MKTKVSLVLLLCLCTTQTAFSRLSVFRQDITGVPGVQGSTYVVVNEDSANGPQAVARISTLSSSSSRASVGGVQTGPSMPSPFEWFAKNLALMQSMSSQMQNAAAERDEAEPNTDPMQALLRHVKCARMRQAILQNAQARQMILNQVNSGFAPMLTTTPDNKPGEEFTKADKESRKEDEEEDQEEEEDDDRSDREDRIDDADDDSESADASAERGDSSSDSSLEASYLDVLARFSNELQDKAAKRSTGDYDTAGDMPGAKEAMMMQDMMAEGNVEKRMEGGEMENRMEGAEMVEGPRPWMKREEVPGMMDGEVKDGMMDKSDPWMKREGMKGPGMMDEQGGWMKREAKQGPWLTANEMLPGLRSMRPVGPAHRQEMVWMWMAAGVVCVIAAVVAVALVVAARRASADKFDLLLTAPLLAPSKDVWVEKVKAVEEAADHVDPSCKGIDTSAALLKAGGK